MIRAVALAHGELTGNHPSQREAKALGLTDRGDYLVVRAPGVYGTANESCIAKEPSRTAACLHFDGSTRDTDVGTYVARHPPAYYGVVGAVSWIARPGSGTVYLMRFVGVLITGAFIATAITALWRSAAPRIVAIGLATAITPMVLFVSGTVNPSAPEIAAALAFWVCGLVLIRHARERVDNWLVTAVGIAGCVLALSRQLGPLWLGLIVLTMLGVTNRADLRELARSKRVRVWSLLVVMSSVVQLGWELIAKPLDVTRSGHAPAHLAMTEIVQNTVGRTFIWYREMIGWFGWLDTPSPVLTWVPWTVAIGMLVLTAAVWSMRRHVAVLLGLLAATVIVPVAIESATYADAGTNTWQGRYTLPLAVGIPILAAVTLSVTRRGRELATTRLVVAVAALLSGAQIIAFAQNLRRYSVGYDGDIQFWKHAAWSPPGSSLLLTVAFAIVVIAFVCWLVTAVSGGAERSRSSTLGGVERKPGLEETRQNAVPSAHSAHGFLPVSPLHPHTIAVPWRFVVR